MNKTILAMILGATNASAWWALAMFGYDENVLLAAGLATLLMLAWIIMECIDCFDQ